MAKNEMNEYQQLWWQQVKSDFAIWRLLRQNRTDPCHQLHYLQMVTEKISKAYLWRSGRTPTRTHVGFVDFFRSLTDRSKTTAERTRIAEIFGFKKYDQFQRCMFKLTPLLRELEQLAPALAGDGPNPEYPWPHQKPKYSPATYHFPVWTKLMESAQGRSLCKFVDTAVGRFSEFA
ncbi:MAG: hypothetical protein O2955_00240 [Planctomycetota bacterium]|nr:hypothetical protein [Planctomycetota bacterium]MDA1210909.1 hypothetical protein [Planctomycetota bacterium]